MNNVNRNELHWYPKPPPSTDDVVIASNFEVTYPECRYVYLGDFWENWACYEPPNPKNKNVKQYKQGFIILTRYTTRHCLDILIPEVEWIRFAREKALAACKHPPFKVKQWVPFSLCKVCGKAIKHVKEDGKLVKP